jgi:hypothetical protein
MSGLAKARPDSLTPRRLAMVSNATKPTEMTTACAARAGTALVIAATPATTDTATVNT